MKHSSRLGFTLIELLVVISIIALLIAILLPALSGAKESSVRIQCLTYQRQMVTASSAYATNEKQNRLIPARIGGGGFVQQALNVNKGGWNGLENAAAGVKEFEDNGFPVEYFQDPGRDFEPYRDMNSFVIAYQYFGGITKWHALPGTPRTMEDMSPVTLDDMTSDKTMVACGIMKQSPRQSWGQITSTAARAGGMHQGAPAHGIVGEGNGAEPVGGNHVFADGSGRWVEFAEMQRLQSWSLGRPNYYFQEDLEGYTPPPSN